MNGFLTGKKYFSNFSSPIGNLIIAANDEYVLSVKFSDNICEQNENDLCKTTKEQLEEYFSGKRKSFELPLKFNGTDFQNYVWLSLQKIQFGSLISYEKFSEMIGSKKKIRAVANANSKNPFVIIIPCHRVIGKNGKLVGYSAGLDKKRWLIDFELSITKDSLTLF